MNEQADKAAEPGRVCLFGGTFDPVHLGHTAAAGLAVRELQLDQVRFLPCRISPHKLDRETAASEHRVAMLELALGGLDWAIVDRFDLDQPEPSYSYRTALAMRDRFPGARLFWLVGGDQWDELPSWHRADRLAEILEFIVVRRGAESAERCGWTSHFLPAVLPASGTEIRRHGAEGPSADWLHPSVHKYILSRRLYGS